jgi:hypothetical protein
MPKRKKGGMNPLWGQIRDLVWDLHYATEQLADQAKAYASTGRAVDPKLAQAATATHALVKRLRGALSTKLDVWASRPPKNFGLSLKDQSAVQHIAGFSRPLPLSQSAVAGHQVPLIGGKKPGSHADGRHKQR